ncbi:MAG: hypothetical protein VR71_18960 [Roseovarius sp. BRH_c41]|jgi:hypothetical protein|nr:MAG: hypothetical protein VR71_18960 [Roseovarius sp. BRH_c41]
MVYDAGRWGHPPHQFRLHDLQGKLSQKMRITNVTEGGAANMISQKTMNVRSALIHVHVAPQMEMAEGIRMNEVHAIFSQ